MRAEMRKDYIQDRYVLIAPKRERRSHDFERPELISYERKTCNFCPVSVDNKKDLLTIGPKNNWYVKVLGNEFPAVSVSNPKAYGQHEIVIETNNHMAEMEDLPAEHIVKILEAYSHRTRELSKNEKIEYIEIFKNNGGSAGASMQHSHSQIFATAFLPPLLFDRSQKALAYRIQQGSCVYCDVIKKERKSNRFIWQDKHAIAFAPYASFHSYQTWIMPLRHMDNITELNKDERLSIAKVLKHILQKIGRLQLPYNFYFHQVIRDKDQHFYITVSPRATVWGGVEMGSGLIINPVSPEDAARYYRGDLKI